MALDRNKRIKRIKIAGYKSIQSLDLELRSINVLIGPNGAGKSNFISLFRLLNQMNAHNLQLAVRRAGGADTLLYFGEKTTPEIAIDLQFDKSAYHCVWVPTVADELVFAAETISFYDEGHEQPVSIPLGTAHLETQLHDDSLEIVQPTTAAGEVSSNLANWRVYHFHDTSESAAVKKPGPIYDNSYLRGDASNLAARLFYLQQAMRRYYDRIVATIRQVAPFFGDFLLRPYPDNHERIRLEWREQGSDYPFLAHHLSDGTLRFICLCTLLLQPELPYLILVDEPELGLHPHAIMVLASLIRQAARRTQILISTQSVALVDQFDPEDLLIVERPDRATTIRRVDPARLTEWLDEYSLSELWEKNVLGGRP